MAGPGSRACVVGLGKGPYLAGLGEEGAFSWSGYENHVLLAGKEKALLAWGEESLCCYLGSHHGFGLVKGPVFLAGGVRYAELGGGGK